MEPELISDAHDDLDPYRLDHEIFLMTEACPEPTSPIAALCAFMGVAVDEYFALATANLLMRERVWSGHMPEPQRRNVRHRVLRDGIRTRGPVNPYDAQRAAAARGGFVGGRYVGGKAA